MEDEGDEGKQRSRCCKRSSSGEQPEANDPQQDLHRVMIADVQRLHQNQNQR